MVQSSPWRGQSAYPPDVLLDREILLRSVSNQIHSSLDLNTILSTTVREVRRLLDTDRVLIYQFFGDWRGKVVIEEVIEPWQSTLGEIGQDNCFQEAYAQLYINGRIRAIDNLETSGLSQCHISFLQRLQVQANLIVPIVIQKQLWGLLIAHECRAERAWQKWEINFLRELADQLEIAIQQAELFSQIQSKAERESLLRLITNQIRSTLELTVILKTAVQQVRQLFDTDRVVIYQFTDGWQGTVVVEDVLLPWVSTLGEIGTDDCFAEQYAHLYAEGRVRAINDILKAGLDNCHIQFLQHLQVRANLIVPIRIGNQIWGLMIAHECRGERSWRTWEVEFLQQLADQLAIAIQQAELYNQIQQSADQLRLQSQQFKKTLDDLRSTQTQLIQSEKLSSLGQMVAGIAHEINNANNFIQANIPYAQEYVTVLLQLLDLYNAAYPEASAEITQFKASQDISYIRKDASRLFRSMAEGAKRIREIMTTLRNFARLDESDYKWVDLHEGLESTLVILQHRLRPVKLIKQYEPLPLVECQPKQINQVFLNLLTNALDACDSDAEILLRTEPLGNDRVLIAIRDNGCGIPLDIQHRIFDPFFTTKPTGKGTGLGLSIVHQIITQGHGGKIRCLSQPNHGAEFQIELPIQQANTTQASATKASFPN